MYKINDNKSSIKAIQRYLEKLYGSEIVINQNGIFDDNTILALNKFQRDNSIDVKVYADQVTFNALYNAYLDKVTVKAIQANLPRVRFPIKRGDKSPFVTSVNDIMREILDYYSIHFVMPTGDYFSNDSEEAVKILSGIFGFDIHNTIDERLYSRLKEERKSISRIKSCKSDYFSL